MSQAMNIPACLRLVSLTAIGCVSTVVACSDPVEGVAPDLASSASTTGTGGTSAASGTVGSGGDSSTMSSSVVSSSTGMTGPVALPFAVDDYFFASGYMGDGEIDGNLSDSEMCPMRAGDAQGLCHRIDYTVSSNGWAGIYWQHPDGNWGMDPGLEVSSNAVKVSFWAWSDQGGQAVNFFAGGIGDASSSHADTFKVEESVTLANTPKQYTLVVGAEPHERILGGFGWSVDGNATGSFAFYIDDIQYQSN
jgi:hypothetical protein